MSGVNVRNLEKIQDKWHLFQRFVTSIVATSKEEKCGVENGDELIYLTIFNLGDET